MRRFSARSRHPNKAGDCGGAFRNDFTVTFFPDPDEVGRESGHPGRGFDGMMGGNHAFNKTLDIIQTKCSYGTMSAAECGVERATLR